MSANLNPVALEIETPDGCFVAHYSSAGLCGLNFPTARQPHLSQRAATPAMQRWHRQVERAVRAALASRPCPPLPPLDWAGASEFQQQVWAALRQIPAGEVRTYGQLAAALGRPGGARAVGSACGANPIPLLVPCHRVVAANGQLGGFSAGLKWKRLLLERERP